jgi:hypothetical protein
VVPSTAFEHQSCRSSLPFTSSFTRENLSLEVDTSLSSRRVTRSLEGVIERRLQSGVVILVNVKLSGYWRAYQPHECKPKLRLGGLALAKTEE